VTATATTNHKGVSSMSKQVSNKGQKVYEFFRKNPNASASATAAKHKMSISNVYKMRARALEDLRNFVVPEMLPMPEVKSSWQKVVEEVESVNVDKTLNARAEMYGKFKDGARFDAVDQKGIVGPRGQAWQDLCR
jgi:hypothetical protein